MSSDLRKGFRLGAWQIEPLIGAITGSNCHAQHLEPKVMDVFVFLAEHANELVTRDQLLEAVWSGHVAADELLTGAVSDLRRALRDGRGDLKYIETVPKRGYRLVGQVRLLEGIQRDKSETPRSAAAVLSARHPAMRHRMLWVVGIALVALLAAALGPNLGGLQNRLLRGIAPEPITSIAVLPFVNVTGDREQEYFADAMTDALITELSKIGALRVISRQSVMQFKDTDEPMLEIARKLNVDTVVEGSALHIGDHVRISVQLIDAATDTHLWADSYDRELTPSNIFAIQSEITTAVANELRATLSPEEQIRLGTVPTESMAALEAYFLGKQRMAKRTTQALAEANEYFQNAIDLDAKFALAYVGLADTYTLQIGYAGLPKIQTTAKAKIAIEKALELDDRLSEAYVTLAMLRAGANEYEAAEIAFTKAIELTPSYAMAYHFYGGMLRNMGQYEEALALHQNAVELDPLSSIIILNVGNDLLSLGRFDEALARYRETIANDPGFAPGYIGIARFHRFVSGRIDEAVKWEKKSISIDPGQVGSLGILATDYLHLGDSDSAEYWLNREISQGPESFSPNLNMQAFHAFRGDDAATLSYGRKAIAIEPRNSFAIMYLRDLELRAGRYTEARALYEKSFPELLTESAIKIDRQNVRAAIDLACVLKMTGEQDRADLLLNRSLQHIQTTPRDGRDRDTIADVQIYALQDRRENALSALRQAVDEGWRNFWWYYLKQDPALKSIRDEPEFQAIVNEIEADMAAQLMRLNEFESSAPGAADSKL